MLELVLKDVSYSYGEEEFTLNNINWQLPRGEIHTWLGKSGSGKTSLLKLAAGLKQPTSGQISYRGSQVHSPLSDIGFIFQEATLLPWKKVSENVLLPIKMKRKITIDDVDYAKSLFDILRIKNLYNRYPSTLSGGQKSRVAIARALITQPTLLFCDEPFAALDLITKEELQNELLKLNKEKELAMLFVTHDINEAAFLADRIGIMDKGKFIGIQQAPLWEKIEQPRRNSKEFREFCGMIRQLMEGVSYA